MDSVYFPMINNPAKLAGELTYVKLFNYARNIEPTFNLKY